MGTLLTFRAETAIASPGVAKRATKVSMGGEMGQMEDLEMRSMTWSLYQKCLTASEKAHKWVCYRSKRSHVERITHLRSSM